MIEFTGHPDGYRHWKLMIDGPAARLAMDNWEDGGLVPGHALKLNSYDLDVDIELDEVVQRLRFEHSEVRAVRGSRSLDRRAKTYYRTEIYIAYSETYGWSQQAQKQEVNRPMTSQVSGVLRALNPADLDVVVEIDRRITGRSRRIFSSGA